MNKKVLILSILTVLLSITIAVGFSYAVWTQTKEQEDANELSVGCLDIQITKQASDVNLANAYPITDDDGEKLVPFTFTIKNNCTFYAHFSLNLEKLSNSDMEDQYIKLQLNNRRPQLYSAYNSETPTTGITSRSLDFGGLEPNMERDYTLRLWIDYDATVDDVGGKTFQGKVVVNSVAAEPTGAEYIENLLVKNTNTMNNDDPDENVRYMGASPNNYVKFNDELWRIIGVFNTYVCEDSVTGKQDEYEKNDKCKQEKLLKIIKKDFLVTTMAWNSSSINDWSTSTLQAALNGDYYNRINSYSTDGLNDTTRAMVANVVWTLGGLGEEYPSKGTAEYFYEKERENLVYEGNSRAFVENVGLMFPSDYGYATGGGTTGRSTCLTKEMYHWDSLSDCHNNNWLFSPSYEQWTLSHYSGDSLFVFYVHSSGHIVAGWGTNSARWIQPVVYLKSDVKILDDAMDGSSGNPYNLVF